MKQVRAMAKSADSNRDPSWHRNPDGSVEPRVVGPGFNQRVYALVRQIPPGQVSTYGDLGTLLGSPRVARQVGYALAALTDPEVPWHRVINAQGAISFKGDIVRAQRQRDRLNGEGVLATPAGRIDLARYRWRGPERAPEPEPEPESEPEAPR
jgi:methylated-DNA-protein-cysteine methyltransferase-like protein